MAIGLTAVVGTAANGDDTGGVNVTKFARVDASLLAAAKNFVPASQSNKPVTIMLQMAGDPVAVQQVAAAKQGKTLSKAEKAAIRAQLKSKQDALTSSINAAGARIQGQLQSAYNGVQVTVAQKNVSQLASLPGVVAVRAVRSFWPTNVHGATYIGAPTAWGDYSRTGAGVKVAVIDTGIDYTHADFGGLGTIAAFDAASTTSTAAADPSMFGPAAPKVKGGTDFVGDDYNADPASSGYQPVPHPDPNPLDCNGHGSHTAGTAAGFGTLADGHTYHGPYNGSTLTTHDFTVGPGIAPEAEIYAYRVFGCDGSSDIVDLAIDQAVVDGVGVISMSLGSSFGGQDDPTTVAAENAAAAGIAVVASAGNSGPSGYIVGSPSTGNHVLSVAAIDASVPSYPGAKLNLSTGSTVDTIVANGAPLPSGSFPVTVLKTASGAISLGCDPAEYAGTAGKVVVTKRGTCARVARAVFGQQAGAAAVVMVNNATSLPPFEGPITGNPDDPSDHTHVTIPFLGAAGTAANTAALLAADGGTTTLSSFSISNDGYAKAASFSSGGPRNPDSAPKPDVMAPGVAVASVGVGTGNGFAIISGTSMACPMTAGIAALVKQAHPLWSATQVKAAIQNTADASLDLLYNVRIAGTGVVQAQKAVNTTVLATTADGLNSVAFGHVPGAGSYSSAKTITLSNTGTTDATYSLAAEANGNQRGTSVTVSPDHVTVRAGSSVDVTVTLSIPSGAFTALPSNDSFVVGPGGVITVRGAIVATPTAGPGLQQLRVAYLVAPRGLSNLTGSLSNRNGNYTARVTNAGIHAGDADIYAWGQHDASGEPSAAGDSVDMRDVGVQVVDGKTLGGKNGDTGLNFLISNYNASATQAVNEYDVVIDTTGDGAADFVVFGADTGAVLSGSFDGTYASFIVDLHTGALVDAWYAEAPMNGSIVELPFLASEIGLTPGHSRFTYAVQSFSLVNGSTDSTGPAVFDAHSLPVTTGFFGSVAPGGTANIPLTVNAGQLSQTPVKGWLLATVDDANGASEADELALP